MGICLSYAAQIGRAKKKRKEMFIAAMYRVTVTVLPWSLLAFLFAHRPTDRESFSDEREGDREGKEEK